MLIEFKLRIMEKKNRHRYPKQTKENVVSAIVKGELWLHEAKEKFKINHSRTVISWLREYLHEKNIDQKKADK